MFSGPVILALPHAPERSGACLWLSLTTAALQKHLYLLAVIGHSAGQLHPMRNGRTCGLARASLELADLGRDPD
jgi:hypothetical protein